MARYGHWPRGGALVAACTLIGALLAQPAVAMRLADPGTQAGGCTIRGTAGADDLVGSSGDDVICGLGGDDRLDGRGGDDRLAGGGGDDRLRGGGGEDVVLGGAGHDLLKGTRGADRLEGGPGDDVLFGGAQADELNGGAGDDRMGGGLGADDLAGGPGTDLAYYGQRRRPVSVAIGDGANDGSAGERDDVRAGVENLRGGRDDDVLRGDRGANWLWGKAGSDRLTGGAGDDRLSGGSGHDRLDAREGVAIAADGGAAAVDRVGCGRDADRLLADVSDRVAADCERVSRVAPASPSPLPATPPPATNRRPVDITLSNARVDENEPAGTTVGTFAAVDPDAGDSHTFALVPGSGGQDNAWFEVAGLTLRTKAAFDFEAKDAYSIRVRVRDARGAAFHKIFAIAVADDAENEVPTGIALSDASVDENEPSGTAVGTLSSSDPDAGDTHAYSLVAGTGDADNGSFAIAGDTLETAAAFDFEAKGSYSVRIRTQDARGAARDQQFTITIANANDAPTAIVATETDVDENEPAGTTVGTLSATDQDAADTHGFSLVSGTGDDDNAAFQITASTLRTAASFNHEVKDSYSIRVRATDSGSPAGTFERRLTIAVTDVNDPPSAVADSHAGAIGNTLFAIGTTPGGPVVARAGALLLANDTDEDEDDLDAIAETVASTGGGTATIGADGSFTFLPGAGDKNQSDTFTYRISDGLATDSGTVTVTIADALVWYVDAAQGGGGDGRSNAPFNSLAAVNGAGGAGDADGGGDHVFLYEGGYGGGLPLESGQHLIGEPHGLTVSGHALVAPGGANPVVTNAGGAGIALASNAEVQRVDVTGAAGAGITGTAITNATVGSNVTVSGNGGNAFELAGAASGTVGVGASLSSTAARPVSVQDRTGGGVTLSGPVTSTAQGVLLNNNGGASIAFTSGSVALSTGTSDAFRATGGGAVSVTGAANTLAATSGSALVVQSTTIGASGLTFRRIASNGGASSGIVLDGTGSSGGLTVSGDGTPGSGGTIANKTGDDGSTATGVGIALNNTRSVSLARMQLSDFSNYAIRGTNVAGFTLANSVVNGTNGSNANIDEASVAFSQLTGAASFQHTTVSGGIEDNVQVRNSGGTLNRLVFDTTAIGANSSAGGNDGISLEASGSGVFNATVRNSTFTSAGGDLFQHIATGSSSSDLDFTGNTLSNNHPNIAAGGGGVTISAAQSGDLTYDITGNTLRDSKGTALLVSKIFGGAPADGTATGTISGNTIGVAGVANSGSREGSGIEVIELARGGHTTEISGNQIRGYNNYGILVSVGGADSGLTGVTHDGDLNATIRGNQIAQPGTLGALAMNGLHVNSGTNTGDAYDTCLDIGAVPSTLTGSGAVGGTDYRVRQRMNTTIRLPGYTGPATGTLDAPLTSYLTPRTSGSFTLSSTTSGTGGGFVNTPGGGPCPQP